MARQRKRKATYDGLTADQKHKILREAYRNYLTFQDFVSATGKDIIEYAVPTKKGSREMVMISISYSDLERALHQFSDGIRSEGTVLSARKEEAFHLNVIRDMLQRDVAEIMNISPVSVGQYVDQACLQLSEYYFGENSEDTKS
jgi:DNA-directed RNA polymerase specialized sigma24 family protein